MNISNWIELAAMLTVVIIIGRLFTGFEAMIVERKLSEFAISLRREFVTQKEMEFYAKERADHHARFSRSIDELWIAVNELRRHNEDYHRNDKG